MNNTNVAQDMGFTFVSDLANQLNEGKLEIPAFPDSALRIRSVLKDPDVTAEQVARVVISDPVISASLLKIANSVMYNAGGQKIDEIPRAITRIGFEFAYNIVMSVAVEQVLNSNTAEKLRPYMQDLWRHSVQVAAFSSVIAKKQTRIKPDTAMLAGLLHDIGKYYILVQSEHYPDLFNEPEVLLQIMQEWHTGIGRGILEAWNFSEEMVLVADEHNVTTRFHDGPADLTDVVIMANMFAHNDGLFEESSIDWDSLTAAQRLELNAETADEILKESKHEIESIVNALNG